MKIYIDADELYPWFEFDEQKWYGSHEAYISEEQFKKLQEMKAVVTQYQNILKGLHQEWSND